MYVILFTEKTIRKILREVMFMLIETQRLVIRDLKSEDTAVFAEMAADGSLSDCGFDRDCGSWIAKWAEEAKNFAIRNDPGMDYLAYTVTLKDSDVVIGSVGCSYYEDLQKTGITFFIGARYRNNGYAAEAASAYADYFFEHYKIRSLIATVRADNVSSWKAIEKAGFKLTEKRMYQDMGVDMEKLYHFYEKTK